MTNEIAIPEKDETSINELARLEAFIIKTNEDYLLLDQMCVAAKQREKNGESLYRDVIKEADAHHKGLIAKLKAYVGPTVEFIKLAKVKMDIFRQEQEKIRQVEERRLQEIARKMEEDRKLAEATMAEQAGDKAEAEQILNTPVEVPTVVLPKSMPKSSTVIRKIKKYRVINESAVPRQYLIIDGTKIGQVVRALGFQANIPGIEVYEEVC